MEAEPSPTDVLLAESRRFLDNSLRAMRELETKAIEIMRIDGTILGLAATGVGLWIALRPAVFPSAGGWFLIFALAGVLVSLFLCLLSFLRSEVSIGVAGLPDAARLEISRPQLLRFVVDAYDEGIRMNRSLADQKSALVQYGLVSLCLGLIFLAAATAALLAQMVGG